MLKSDDSFRFLQTFRSNIIQYDSYWIECFNRWIRESSIIQTKKSCHSNVIFFVFDYRIENAISIKFSIKSICIFDRFFVSSNSTNDDASFFSQMTFCFNFKIFTYTNFALFWIYSYVVTRSNKNFLTLLSKFWLYTATIDNE